MSEPDLLIFDMDGVLVDVRASYREAVRCTVAGYLALLLDEPPGARRDWVSLEDVAALKLASGFNNDWALTTALVQFLLAHLPPLEGPEPPPGGDAAGLLAALRGVAASRGDRAGGVWSGLDIPQFAREVDAAGGGLAGVRRVLGDFPNRRFVLAGGDLRRENLVMRMFQEVYLGGELFARIYGVEPVWHQGEGLIHRESLIPARDTLEALAARRRLAIATGRPRQEALHALEQFQIRDFFQGLVTLDDVEEAESGGGGVSLGKPHPFPLLLAARRAGADGAACAYVGDQPDDMLAARRAGREQPFWAVGCVAAASDPRQAAQALQQAGADRIVDHPDELVNEDLWGGAT